MPSLRSMTEGFVAKHHPLAPYTSTLQSSLQASFPSTTINVTNAGEAAGRGRGPHVH